MNEESNKVNTNPINTPNRVITTSNKTEQDVREMHNDTARMSVDTLDSPAATNTTPSCAHQLKAPVESGASQVSVGDAHTAMDLEKAALASRLNAASTLNDALDVASRIAALHGKPLHANEVCEMADQLIDSEDMREQVKLAAKLVVIGEWNSPAKVMLGGRLSNEDKRAHIFPINSRAADALRRIDGGQAIADAIEGSSTTGITPWLHATRDISAMDAPRKWRQDETHPDGRLSLQEITHALIENNARPGRDPQVTATVLARYEALRAV